MKSIVFISDVHIGDGSNHDTFDADNELIAVLDKLDREDVGLVLNGDFFELLQIAEGNKIKKIMDGHKKLFDRLKAFAKKHKVYFVAGNHDQELCWNKELQAELKKANIEYQKEICFEHIFSNGAKIYAEHGNQLDSQNRFIDMNDPKETPVGHHMVLDVLNKMKRASDMPWLKDLQNVRPLELAPWWLFSKYFYHELSYLLKLFVIPLMIGYLITRLIPVVLLLHFLGFATIDALLSLPTTVIVILIVLAFTDLSLMFLGMLVYLVKRDIFKTLKRFGFKRSDELIRTKQSKYHELMKDMLKGNNTYGIKKKLDADLIVLGHSHKACVEKMKVGTKEKAYANSGTWQRSYVKINSRFRLPPVFIPRYKLTYVKVTQENKGVRVELFEEKKSFKVELTFLSKLATFGKKVIQESKTRLIKDAYIQA